MSNAESRNVSPGERSTGAFVSGTISRPVHPADWAVGGGMITLCLSIMSMRNGLAGMKTLSETGKYSRLQNVKM